MARQAGSAAFCRGTGAGGITPIIVAIPEGAEEIARACVAGIDGVRFITGGETRQQSVRFGLEAMQGDWPRLVLIHDAARPTLPRAVIDRLVDALEHSPAPSPCCPWWTACAMPKATRAA
jgi:2-C-methyl-D-erythritol 4-phosphate cytidylyltransferase/2-C-methyl-D-erythritol 2,4-cyclodiphosphate synthase